MERDGACACGQTPAVATDAEGRPVCERCLDGERLRGAGEMAVIRDDEDLDSEERRVA